jgi:hypothetical protein
MFRSALIFVMTLSSNLFVSGVATAQSTGELDIQAPRRTAVLDTGNRLLDMCEDRGSWKIFCFGIIDGYTDMLSISGQICPANGVDVKQTRDIVIRHLRDHPEIRDKASASLARIALTRAFPCK